MALTSEIVDTFNDNVISDIWTPEGVLARIVEAGGQMSILHTAASEYNTLPSTVFYDLTSSYFLTEVVNVGNQSLVSHEVIAGARADTNNGFWFTAGGGFLKAFKRIGGVNTQVGSSLTLNTNQHKWWRIREVSGTLFWDTSPNSSDWKVQWSLANPFAITAVQPYLQSGCYATEASASLAVFDNFNSPRGVLFNNRGLRPRIFAPGRAR